METQTAPDARGASRRTIIRTAAWATPVVLTAVAAPSFAAGSGTDCTQLGSATLTPNRSGVVDRLVFPGGVSATISYAKTAHGRSRTPFDGETGHVFSTDYGTPWDYIRLHHPEGMDQNDTLTMTIDFAQPVSSFSLTLTDIDMSVGSWIDEVSLAPASFVVDARGKNVVGGGTAGDPFTSAVDDNINSAAGDVTVTWAGPAALQAFTITYVAADADNRSNIGQMIGIGKFSYNNC
jgi:hypothetical protein